MAEEVWKNIPRLGGTGMSKQIPVVPILEHFGASPKRLSTFSNWTSLKCCFHDDENASASYNYYGFRCFACGVSGDAIALLMSQEGLEYRAAEHRAEELARDFGEVVQSESLESNRLPGRAWNPGGSGQRGATGLRGRPATRSRAV